MNYELFDKYALKTAQLFISNYGLFNMPVSVHTSTILVHGSGMIKFVLVPVGQLSEATQEAKNKHIK
jgi:hypothetical protein